MMGEMIFLTAVSEGERVTSAQPLTPDGLKAIADIWSFWIRQGFEGIVHLANVGEKMWNDSIVSPKPSGGSSANIVQAGTSAPAVTGSVSIAPTVALDMNPTS